MTKNRELAVRGVTVSWAGYFCGFLVTLFVTPALVHGLGDATYGIWSIVMTLTGYYGLVDLGIGKASTKYLAQFDATNDDRSVAKVLATSLSTYAVMAVIVLAVSAVVGWCFPLFFTSAGHSDLTIFWVVLLTGARVSAGLLGTTFRCAIMARKRFDYANVLAISAQITMGLCAIAIIKSGGGILELAGASLAVGMLTQVAMYWIARRWVGVPKVSMSQVDQGVRKTLFRFGSFTVLAQASKRLGTYSGSLIIGIVLGPAAVAYYSVAQALTQKCALLGKALNQVCMPFASQFDAEGRREGLIELMLMTSRIHMAMAFFFATILGVLGHAFIAHWIGPDFASHAYPVFLVLSLALLFRLPGNGLQALLTGIGRVKVLGAVAVVEGIVITILGVLLVAWSGLVGMAWAIFLTQVVTCGAVLPAYACKVLEYPVWRFYARVVLPAAGSAVPGLLVALIVRYWFVPQNVFEVVLEMGIVGVFAGVSAFFVCLDSAMREACVKAMLPRFCRSRRNEPVTRCLADEN